MSKSTAKRGPARLREYMNARAESWTTEQEQARKAWRDGGGLDRRSTFGEDHDYARLRLAQLQADTARALAESADDLTECLTVLTMALAGLRLEGSQAHAAQVTQVTSTLAAWQANVVYEHGHGKRGTQQSRDLKALSKATGPHAIPRLDRRA